MACKVTFNTPRTNNKSADLFYATVTDSDGIRSKLWDDIQKAPFGENLEQVFDTFIGAYDNKFTDGSYLKYQDTNEPVVLFKSDKDNVFKTYKEALLDSTPTGKIHIGFVKGETAKEVGSNHAFTRDADIISIDGGERFTLKNNSNFESFREVTANTNVETIEGFVNNSIKEGYLTGETYAKPDGTFAYAVDGEIASDRNKNMAFVMNDAVYASMDFRAVKDSDKYGVTFKKREESTAIINGTPMNLEEATAWLSDPKNHKKLSQEELAEAVVDNFFATGEYARVISGVPSLNKEVNKQALQKLTNVMSSLGIKLTSMSEYVNRYKAKHNIDPNARALVDLAEGIIAISENASLQDLSEEVVHLLVEGLDSAKLDEIFSSEEFYNSQEYKEHFQNYFMIYANQGERRTLMANKEILGKIINNNLLAQLSNAQTIEQTNFFNSIIEAIQKLVNTIKGRLGLQQNQTALQEVIEELSLAVINNKANEVVDMGVVKEDYKGAYNPIMYASSSIRREIELLEDALGELERRIQVIRQSSNSESSTHKQEILSLRNQLNTGHNKLAIKTYIGIVEGINNKALRNIGRLMNNTSLSPESVMHDATILHKDLIPALREMRGIVDFKNVSDPNDNPLGLTISERDAMLSQIDRIFSENSILVSRFSSAYRHSSETIFTSIAAKYGVSEEAMPAILAALNTKQGDIHFMFKWMGNPEFARIPEIGLMSKIFSTLKINSRTQTQLHGQSIIDAHLAANITSEQQRSLLSVDSNGKFTGYLIDPSNHGVKEAVRNERITDIYNEVMFGADTSLYVTTEERKKMMRNNGEPLKNPGDIDTKTYYTFTRKVAAYDETVKVTKHKPEVYRTQNNINEALGISNATISVLSDLSSRQHRAMSKVVNSKGEIITEKLTRHPEVAEELEEIKSERADRSSLVDVRSGVTYATISPTDTELIAYRDEIEGKDVVLEIPLVVPNPTIDLDVNEAAKIAIDLTRKRLLDMKRFENDQKAYGDNYLQEVHNIADGILARHGLTRSSTNIPSAVKKEVNDALRNFLRIAGGFSFNEDFYDAMVAGGKTSMRDQLKDVVKNFANSKTTNISQLASKVLQLQDEKSSILRKFRSNISPAEINADLMDEMLKREVERIDSELTFVRRQLRREADLVGVTLEYTDNDLATYELNEAFRTSRKNSGLSHIDFVLKNISNENRTTYGNIKEEFFDLPTKGTTNKAYIKFLKKKGLMAADGSLVKHFKDMLINQDEDAVGEIITEFLSPYVASYYKRYVPKGYDVWMNDLQNGIYRNEFGDEVLLTEFFEKQLDTLKSGVKQYNSDVEQYLKITPTLAYSEGSSKRYQDTLNPEYDLTEEGGGAQYKIDNHAFFDRFKIDMKEYINNPDKRAEILEKAAEKNSELKYWLEITKAHKTAYENYGMGGFTSKYRIGHFNTNEFEARRRYLQDPMTGVRAFKRNFMDTVEDQDQGSADMYGNVSVTRKVIPKYGVYEIEDMNNLSTDLTEIAQRMLLTSFEYNAKQTALTDLLQLMNIADSRILRRGNKMERSNAVDMMEEFINANIYGIRKTLRANVNIGGMTFDFTRMVMFLDRLVGMTNTALSAYVAATAATSAGMFSTQEAQIGENFSMSDWKKANSVLISSGIDYIKEVSDLDRSNPLYKMLRGLGLHGYDIATNAKGSTRGMERVTDNIMYKLTEMSTAHITPRVALGAMIGTKFYNGRWMFKQEFENLYSAENNTTVKEASTKWDSLPSLYEHYEVGGNGLLKLSDKGVKLMSDYYSTTNPTYTDAQIKDLVDNNSKNVFTNVALKISSLNAYLEGAQLEEQQASARRNPITNMLFTNRGWFYNKVQKLASDTHYNFLTGQFEKGYLNHGIFYRMFQAIKNKDLRLLAKSRDVVTLSKEKEAIYEWIKSKYGEDRAERYKQEMLNLEVRNDVRHNVDFAWVFIMIALGVMAKSYTDDEERRDDQLLQFAALILYRTANEAASSSMYLGSLQTPDMAGRPFMMVKMLNDFTTFSNWSMEPVESGNYEGMPRFMKNIISNTPFRQLWMYENVWEVSKTYRHYNQSSIPYLQYEAEDE